MRLARLVCAFSLVLAIGCGGDDDNAGDDDGITLVDAAPPDGEPPPPPPDAHSCVGAPNPDICGDLCVDFDTDETNCGDCGHACNGGEYCGTGECACPGAIVPAAPVFAQSQVQNVQGFIDLGIGGYNDPNNAAITNGLVLTKAPADGTTTGQTYNLSDTIFTPPTMAAVYNGNIQAQSYDSAFMATAGTVVFDTICEGGFSGHADGVTFQGITGSIQAPEVDPNGCTFTVERIDFTFGTECPTE